MIPSLKKRFWKQATAEPCADGFTVHLDGRAFKTPAKSDFVLPTKVLADAIASEWQAQVDEVKPATMPMTRRANAAIDKVGINHRDVALMLAAYGGSDLLCYRAEHPEELCDRQAAVWDPILAWAAEEFSAPLLVTQGVMPRPQPEQSLANMTRAVLEIEAFPLAGFHDLVSITGSLIIGFAVIRGQQKIGDLWLASRVDETWQADQWGRDEVAAAEAELKRQDFLDADVFYRACF